MDFQKRELNKYSNTTTLHNFYLKLHGNIFTQGEADLQTSENNS